MSGHRNFGIMSRPEVLSGSSNSRPATRSSYAPRDPSNLVQFPPGSILQRHLDHVQEPQPRLNAFEFGSRVFVSVFLALVFLVPMICIGVIMGSR